MVKTCDLLIAYAWHPASSARNLVEYAEALEVAVINLTCIDIQVSFQE